jgi:hypothetical protein
MVVFMGVLALLAIYFLGAPSKTYISDMGDVYLKPIIIQLSSPDITNVDYPRPIRVEYLGDQISNLKEIAFILFFILFFQLSTYLAMRGKPSFINFKPFIAILSISALIWTGMFYAIGYEFWKILLVASITVPLAPLVWQAFNVYRVKLKLEGGLEKWGGFTEDRLN